jgi:3-hydroxyacyl-CoA dehydrogenase
MLQTMSNARFVEGDEVWAPLIARIEPLVAKGHLGVKTGQGFFEYPNSKPN